MSEAAGSGAFAGQLALVTGASRGIGAAIAEALAREGAHVILTARDAKALEAVEEAIHRAGGHATIAPVDLTEADGISRLATAIHGRWDKLDILVLNAGVLPQLTSVVDIDPAAFSKALTVNLLAPQALIAAFDPMLRKSPRARVVGITSAVASAPRAYFGAYGASKAAFENLLDAYAQEVRNISKIGVAIVNPKATRTAMRARAYPGEDPSHIKPPEVVAEQIIAILGKDFASPTRESVNAAS